MTYSRPSQGLRVGDAERDAAVELINRHFAAGRLTALEREERTEMALTARTVGDLDVLFADLPTLDSPDRGKTNGRRRSVIRHAPQTALGAVIAIMAVFLALHLIPVFAAAAVLFIVARVAFGQRGWCHPHSHRGRW